jgi:hypothetical protein
MSFEEQMQAISQRLDMLARIQFEHKHEHDEWRERSGKDLDRSREDADRSCREADERARRLDERWAEVADAIDRLARIAGLHQDRLDDHEQRLDDLEGR